MTSYEDVMNPDRISQLSEIVPKFNEYVKEGDVLLLGMEGDPLYPYDQDNRPEVRVKRILRDSDGNTEIVGRNMSTGRRVTIPKSNVDPKLLYEFSDDTFQKVIERNMNKNSNSSEGLEYRGSPAPSMNNGYDMEARLANYEQAFEEIAKELQETRQFNSNVVKTFKEVSKDVKRLDQYGDCKFCDLYLDEYRANLSQSDSSSDSEMSEMSSDSDSSDASSEFSDFSSDQSDFAERLLRS